MFIPHLEIALIIKRNFVQILRIFENLSPFSNQKPLSFYEEGSYIYIKCKLMCKWNLHIKIECGGEK